MEIRLDNLKKRYGNRIVLDIPHLVISHGELLGLVGNNGAGKTTLFRLMLDLLKSDEGCINLLPSNNGSVVNKLIFNPAECEGWKPFTGAFMDESFLIDFLSTEEYFDFIANVNGLPPINWKEIENSSLAPFLAFASGELFGQRKLLRDLSAGNKQKVGIISALFAQPEFVVLDEPFNFLDPSGQNQLKKLLVEYQRVNGATILVSSHNLQHVEDICTRIVLLEKGIVKYDLRNEDGCAATVLDHYFAI